MTFGVFCEATDKIYAPGIEIVKTYNLLTHEQIVGMVMKKLI